PEEWQPLAEALKNAAMDAGLKFDAGCTTDSARVLRVPDTVNKKYTPPLPVTLVESKHIEYDCKTLEKILPPYKGIATNKLTQPKLGPNIFPPRLAIKDSDLGAGLEKEPIWFDIDDVANECALVRDAIATGGKDYTNPLWNLTTLISTFCKDG